MRAGDKGVNNSVSPLETEVANGGGDDDGVVEFDSEGEDLKMETGEVCERIRLKEDGAILKKLIDPKLPSQEMVDDHWLRGHVEYRNWCEVCVKARGKEWDHTTVGDKERLMPEYSFDYCFPGDEMGFKWTVLVGRERRSKTWMATTIPSKGGMGRFAVDKCLEFMAECGDGERDVIVKVTRRTARITWSRR